MHTMSTAQTIDRPLWTPSDTRVAQANVEAFRDLVNTRHGLELNDYADLLQWSVTEPAAFWDAVWETGGVIALLCSKASAYINGQSIAVDGGRMQSI